jgi:hypothetical protein
MPVTLTPRLLAADDTSALLLQSNFPWKVDQACDVRCDCISRLRLLEDQIANDLLNDFYNGERSVLLLRRRRNFILG